MWNRVEGWGWVSLIESLDERQRVKDKTEAVRFSTLLRSAPAATAIPRRAARSRGLWSRLDPGWKLALWLLVTLRIGLGLVGLLSIRVQPITSIGGNWTNLIVRGGDPWHHLLSMWQRYDALWYQQIATHGYALGNSTVAFYPLYPLVSHITSLVLGGNIVPAELLVSSVAFTVGMWLLYKVARLDAGPIAAQLAVLLTVFFPVGFYLLAPFTESLYLVLSLAAFWFARNGQPWAAGLAGFAAGLTRITAVFLVLPLAFEYLRHRRKQGRLLSLQSIDLVAAALPGLGILTVLAYDRLVIGQHTTPFAAEANWGYKASLPWNALSHSVTHIVALGDMVEVLNLVSLVGFALLAVWVARKLPFAYTLYVVPYLALLLTHDYYFSPLMSISRYVLVLFPCFTVLAMWLVRRPWLAAGTLVTSLLLQVTFFQYGVHFGFVA